MRSEDTEDFQDPKGAFFRPHMKVTSASFDLSLVEWLDPNLRTSTKSNEETDLTVKKWTSEEILHTTQQTHH
jgi:hypothetical protein